MTSTKILDFVGHLHTNSKKKFVLNATGGGTTSFAWLMAVGGASKTVLKLTIPYATTATDEILGGIPEKYVSNETAIGLAKGALETAVELESSANPLHSPLKRSINLFGLAATASIATSYPKKGRHQASIGVYSYKGTTTYSIVLDKGKRSREQEDAIVSLIILKAIAHESLDTKAEPVAEFLKYVDSQLLESEVIEVGQKLFERDRESVLRKYIAAEVAVDPAICSSLPSPRPTIPPFAASTLQYLVFDQNELYQNNEIPLQFNARAGTNVQQLIVYPGYFDPIHEGNIQLMQKARELVSARTKSSNILGVFELALNNPEKQTLDEQTLLERIQKFHQVTQASVLQTSEQQNTTTTTSSSEPVSQSTTSDAVLVVTKASLFIDKARLFPGCFFIVGSDTAAKLVDKKYYNNSDENVMQTVLEFARLGCTFLVAGRWDASLQKVVALENILVPSYCLHSLFVGIPDFVLQ